ncbi:TIGR02117 family protein [Sphingobium sp. H39-3-25]|uniref:TIGR02117 family protein n=1 Tax=Sphingobium arseniciresistens TaxID=3030834 RepID=UPI0023B89FEB|nr:TIGR02117 family protein [Sphingobium arseniciresistens]
MTGRFAGRLIRIVCGLLFALSFALALWAVAVVEGSLSPANRDWHAPAQGGVTIHVYSNGVHTGIVFPIAGPLHDWRGRFPASDLRNPVRSGQWIIIGWGQRDFYLNTPTWADVSIPTVMRAAMGSNDTLIHVDHLSRLWRGDDLRPVTLSPDQYRSLANAIEADFAPGAAIAGYGDDDAFYPARGRYSAAQTCNEWTGAKLRAIGARIGIWTPSAWSVMRWFPASGG